MGDGYEDYEGLEWHVFVSQLEKVAYMGVSNLVRYMWNISGISILVFALIGWAIADQIARPLRTITIAAKEIGRGTKGEMPVVRGIRDVEDLD